MGKPSICSCADAERRLRHLEPESWDLGPGIWRCTTCGEDQPSCAFCTRAAVAHDRGEWVCNTHGEPEVVSTAETPTLSMIELMDGTAAAHRRGAHKAQRYVNCPMCVATRQAVRL